MTSSRCFSAILIPILLAALCLCSTPVEATNPTFPLYSAFAGKPYTVSYDRRSLRLNDQPAAFLSGSIHYPRSTPAMWPQLMKQAAADGLNMIEIYVFWNYHEPVEGRFTWADRGNLTLFLDAIKEAGLFANLRIGPYVCAEWDYGGIPTWLAFKPGMRYRAMNQPWLDAVQQWVQLVIDVTRGYFADHGGPIVLAQVENELNGADQRYVDWNGQLAASMNVNVPWIMCNGQSANNTINTCNGDDCAGFIDGGGQSGRILVDQPAMWTENEGWFEELGMATHPEDDWSDRRPEDMAFVVARWFARGGSHMNYYMYHGGNHYDRTAAGGTTNMYANGVNLHSDGLPNEPKHSHLNQLHYLIAQVSGDLLGIEAQSKYPVVLQWRFNDSQEWTNGTEQLAYEYGQTVFIESSASLYLQTQYKGQVYNMAPTTVLILQGGKIIFNSSDVAPVKVQRVNTPVWDAPLDWQVWSEGVYSYSAVPSSSPATTGPFAVPAGIPALRTSRPVEQLNLTRDLTDYSWYTTVVDVPSALTGAVLNAGSASANSLLVFLNGEYRGQCEDHRKEGTVDPVQCNVTVGDVEAGKIQLSVLSVSFGIGQRLKRLSMQMKSFHNPIATKRLPLCPHALSLLTGNGLDVNEIPAEKHFKGIQSTGTVMLGSLDITHGSWVQRPYLTGEYLALPTSAGHGSVPWSTEWQRGVGQPATWWYAEFPAFDAPSGLHSVLIDLTGFMRGHCYINGHDIGRYWLIPASDGQPGQLLYHIPPDWLHWGQGAVNSVTVLEELGAVDPSKVRVVVSQMVAMEKEASLGSGLVKKGRRLAEAVLAAALRD